MSHTGIRRWAKAAAILTFAAVVTSAAVSRHLPRQQPPLLISLEFAESSHDVRRMTPPDLEAAVMRAQRDDSWLFIPSYWALFAASGMVIMLSGGARNRTLGIAAIAAITVTALLDYAENAAIAAAFTPTAAIAARPAPWALGKWLMLFLTCGLVSAALALGGQRRLHGLLAAALLGCAGILGVAGTLFARDLLEPAVAAMALGLLLLALLWIWNPGYLARSSER